MRVERFLGLCAVGVATPVAIAAWRFGLGTPVSPGAGFWPLSVALAMLGIGALLFLRAQPDGVAHGGDAASGASRWRSFALSLATLVAYIAVLEPLGYLLTTAAMLLVQLRGVEARPWKSSLVIALVASLASLIVFKVLLKVSLPVGVLPLPAGW